MMLINFILVCCALAGCAVVPDDSYYTWYKQGEELKDINVYKVDKEFIKTICRHNQYVIACTLMNFNEGICNIYTTYDTDKIPKKILDHEMKHCNGMNHYEH